MTLIKRQVNLESMWVELNSKCPSLSLSLSCENDMRWLLGVFAAFQEGRKCGLSQSRGDSFYFVNPIITDRLLQFT